MINPKDFNFSIVSDPDIGSYIQFTYTGSNYSEDIWDELEEYMETEFDVCRLEESTYELIDIDPSDLLYLGFKNIH